jgi:hypothetical protein
MAGTEEEEDSAEEEARQDPMTAEDDNWIHSQAKKSLRTDIILILF